MAEMWTSKLGNKFPRTLIEKLDCEHHRVLQQLRKQPANSHCAECGENGTTWASVNIGAFLCVRCADVHRGLGTHVSKVKGCSGTYLWGPDEVVRMQDMGNIAVDAHFGHESASGRPAASASKEERMEICRMKYEQRVWMKPAEDARKSERENPSSTQTAPAYAAAAAQSEASLFDDLFKDSVPQGVTSARHRLVIQRPVFSTPPHSDVSMPMGRELVAESSLFDELFKYLEADTKGRSLGESSTAASEEELIESKVIGKGGVVPAVSLFVAAQAPRVAGISAHQEQADAYIGEFRRLADWLTSRCPCRVGFAVPC